jgi:hypothetical protein
VVFIIRANLDCEARWGNQTLPQHVLRRISSAGALLAAFAPEGDPVELWTPAEVDPSTVHMPNVTMRVGVPAMQHLVWAPPHAKAANDRRLNLALHERLGTLLPGQRVVTSLDDLATVTGPWVCKAPWTAAGRDRAHGNGPPTGELAIYVRRLLDRFGALLYEPWCDRILDVGVCATIDDAGAVMAHAPHTLLSDPRGGFVGIDLGPPALTASERTELDRVVGEAGRALHEVEYAGPFSVDAFVYTRYVVMGEDTYETQLGDGYHPFGAASFVERAAATAFIAAHPAPQDSTTLPIVYTLAEQRALHAPCEINARYTFGHVAHALARRFGARTLGFGPPPEGARILVEDPKAPAWITS